MYSHRPSHRRREEHHELRNARVERTKWTSETENSDDVSWPFCEEQRARLTEMFALTCRFCACCMR